MPIREQGVIHDDGTRHDAEQAEEFLVVRTKWLFDSKTYTEWPGWVS